MLIFVAVVILDQATKIWAVDNLAYRQSVKVLGDFFMLTLIYNKGGALGTAIGPSNYYLIISLILLPFIVYYVYRYRTRPAISWPLALIAAGAVGNIIDRIHYGQVVDFLDVDFFDIGFLGITRWWTFNIADAAISVAIVYLLVMTIFFPHHADDAPRLQRSESITPPSPKQN